MIVENRRLVCLNNIKKLTFIMIPLIFVITIFASHICNGIEEDIKWEIKLNFVEPGGEEDYLIIGEADNAIDGPPQDDYDMPKPPPPIDPYIQVWSNDGLSVPYNLLLADYRKFPDNNKMWNISAIWFAQDNSPTNITITWEIKDLNNFEYDSLKLYRINESQPIADLLLDNGYSTVFNAYDLQQFQIIAKIENPNTNIEITNVAIFGAIIAIIFVLIVGFIIIYHRKKS